MGHDDGSSVPLKGGYNKWCLRGHGDGVVRVWGWLWASELPCLPFDLQAFLTMEEKGTKFPRLAISLIFITNILLITNRSRADV